MSTPVRVLRTTDELAVVLDPLRRRLLDLLDEPDSATGLASRLGLARQRVNYHLRALEDAGLVELVEERQRRGAVERIVRRVVERVVLDPGALTSLPAGRDRDGALGVVAGAADAIRGVAAAATAAADREERLAAATLDAAVRVRSPAALRALLADVADVLAHHDQGDEGEGLRLRVTTLAWPAHHPDDRDLAGSSGGDDGGGDAGDDGS